jgi:hypothetical protein
VPDGWLVCGGVGLLSPIAAANCGAPETVPMRMAAVSHCILRMSPPVFRCPIFWFGSGLIVRLEADVSLDPQARLFISTAHSIQSVRTPVF